MSKYRLIPHAEAAQLLRRSTSGPWNTDAGEDATEVVVFSPLHEQLQSIVGFLNHFEQEDVDLLQEAQNLAYTADVLGRRLEQVRRTVFHVYDHLKTHGLDSDTATMAAELEMLLAGLALPSAGLRWRHVKTGAEYDQVFVAEVQASTSPVREGQRMVVYRGADGQLWAREEFEFHDGRFAAV